VTSMPDLVVDRARTKYGLTELAPLTARARIEGVGIAGFSDILLHLGEFFEICRSLGLQAEAEAGRFGVYRVRIDHLNAEISRLRSGEARIAIYRKLAADLSRYLVALAESQEIGGLLPFLRTCPPEVLVPRLRAILAGPELPSEEDHASNQARNIQFEIWLAATLWRVGVLVTLGEPDLQCKIGGATILFACKRLLTVRNLTKRMNEDTDQLRRSLARLSGDASWGFVAISLSRVLATTDRSEAIANRAEGLERLASRIEACIVRRAKWHQTREAQGILFYAASIFTNSETDRIESGRFVTMYGDGPVCRAVALKLQSAADEH